jgi:hypothetical protein
MTKILVHLLTRGRLTKNHSTCHILKNKLLFFNISYQMHTFFCKIILYICPFFMAKKSFCIRTFLTMVALMTYVNFFAQKTTASFDRERFYTALSSANSDKINEQLELVKKTDIAEKNAFEGTLLMRKAGLVFGAPQKLSLFKEGHKKLENSIAHDTANVEYRFLRLMIQENAPRMLGYKSNINKDCEMIRRNYKRLSQAVQKAITNYIKTSKSLHIDDL